MKTTNKKLVGSLLIGLLFSAIGAVLATAQTDATINETTSPIPFGGRHGIKGLGPLSTYLTDEQQAELNETIAGLRDQNATHEEIQAAIQEKLDGFGVLDIQLDNEIEQTQQRLAILNREKELREEGYSWDEINTITQEEFDLENSTVMGFGMTFDHGFGPGPHGGEPHDFMPGEEIEQ
ncbi:MAG: hypothetical protein A3K77_06770 [Euryarchaeota archaeon RBG_13_31_8]|nr:MAG: hypothetical protein A3K77_06770 [Euryarchaeota archaeon RBG_13_31_8]